MHNTNYMYFSQKMAQKDRENIEENYELIHASTYLQKHKIRCFKYNYSLETEVQNFCQFSSYLFLSKNGEELMIYNKKPKENQPLERTEEDIKKQEEHIKRQKLKQKKAFELRL